MIVWSPSFDIIQINDLIICFSDGRYVAVRQEHVIEVRWVFQNTRQETVTLYVCIPVLHIY